MKHRLLWFLSLGIPLGLIAVRMMVTHSWTYAFYYWNLILALIPLLASTRLRASESIFSLRNLGSLGVWFLFLPNAPYIITDMIHFEARPPVPVYLDEVIVYASAWNGVLLAYASVLNVERWLLLRYASRPVNVLLLSVFLLCGLGIYLGRFSRWNSWDVFFHPVALFRDVSKRVIFPFRYKQTWVVSFLFGGVLAAGYRVLSRGFSWSPAGR